MKLQKRKSSSKQPVINGELENQEEQPSEEPLAKKPKVFSIKQFRKQLNSTDKLTALKEFSSLLSSSASTRHDYVLDYLKNGGTCLELLQVLESDSTVPPAIVFSTVTSVLLGISAKFEQYHSSAYESCRYLINNYLPVIHKMIGLSSSKDERKACIKLLTAMVTFSSSLAKDIIMNVKFHTPNVELLSKHTKEKNGVRDHFIHFLTAFLVDSDLHTLSVLLEKSGLLTSIISGLQYDEADTVVIVITAMKNHILENSSVMKTTKMHVFNTAVVKDIVNLYNWKGPDGLKALEKNNKTVFEVDKLSKSKVSECVHDFLLVLCTSHKHGVIFRDPMVGLGRKNLNGLMYTVLDSLDRPWEHSYAKELVIKICRACPDLTKNMWSIVKPYLEPRNTEKWLKALEFSMNLVQEIDPSCIEHCAKDLNPNQLSQIMEILITPAPILKTLLTSDCTEVKVHILKLLSLMLKKLHVFISASKGWTSNCEKIKHNLTNFVNKNYPNGHALLEEWKNLYLKSDNHVENKQAHLETILDILGSYKDISSLLLQNVSSTGLDFKDFIRKLSETPEDEQEVFETLLVKTVSLFVDTDYEIFLPKSDTFGLVMGLLLKHYCTQKSKQIGEVLFKIFRISGVFDGALYEIPYWVNGIFNQGHFSATLAQDLVNIVIQTAENLPEYQKTLQSLEGDDKSCTVEQEDLIQDLLGFSGDKSDNISKLKVKTCSVMVIGALKYPAKNKSLKKYLEFVLFNLYHSQTDPSKLRSLIDKNSEAVPQDFINYIKPWQDGHPNFGKAKHLLSTFKDVADMFFNDFKVEVLKQDLYPYFLQDVLNMLTFYVSQLAGSLKQSHLDNYLNVVKFILEHQKEALNVDIILGNHGILKHFNTLKPNLLSKLILLTVQELQRGGINVNPYLPHYANKLFANICKLLRKLGKFNEQLDFKEFLQAFPFTYEQTQKILFEATNLLDSHSVLVQSLVAYALESLSQNSTIDNSLIKQISGFLASQVDNSCLAKPLKQYLKHFPCSIEAIHKHLFPALLNMPEYNKDSADLALLLLERNPALAKKIDASICDKKGLVLPLVELLLLKTDTSNEVLQMLYEGLESSLVKALQKPQKVGQHFQKVYKIAPLIERFMPREKCLEFANKVHKFEVTEVFHLELLQACFNKALLEPTSEKCLGNMVMTLIHLAVALFKKKLDSEDDKARVERVCEIFGEVLDKLALQTPFSLNINETYKNFCKFALKFGVSGQSVLLKTLRKLIAISKTSLTQDDATVLMDMLLSHSGFLNLVLGEHCDTKYEILSLMLVISENWGELVEKSHVAVVLSAYRGLVTRCDRVILDLLKIYESKPDRTSFYDFKPFLWGRAAATHYSVRTQIASSLTRQPKISDVLGILKEHLINSTILNHPLTEELQPNKEAASGDLESCYDLKFFLPLFSHILAPEQQVKTYVFIRSGALSLTVLGLACQSKDVRQAACHVLARLHFHLEARQTGKDNLLWIRFVEAICKGLAALPDFKLNNFSGIFFARMALILTNPKHLMYTPLSSYLTAKQQLDLSTCPELYTLLFSPDVNHKEHRNFILEILRDGLKCDKDFLDLLKSMGYKMFSELLNSCLCDWEGKALIFEVLERMCTLPLAVKILTENYSFLSQVEHLTLRALSESNTQILGHVLAVYSSVLCVRTDRYCNRAVFGVVESVFDSGVFDQLRDKQVECVFKIFYKIYLNDSSIVADKEKFVSKLTSKVNDRFCNYLRRYGCGFVNEDSEELSVSDLRLLVFCLLK